MDDNAVHLAGGQLYGGPGVGLSGETGFTANNDLNRGLELVGDAEDLHRIVVQADANVVERQATVGHGSQQ